MKFYSEYSKQYVISICNSLNQAGFKTPIYNLAFIPENISSITELLEGSVAFSRDKFEYLSQRGLVHTGRCPYTGEPINFSSPSYTFYDRKIYVSKKGLVIMQKESAEEYEKATGRPKLTTPVSGGGCYIATVCYGNPYAHEVEGLRIFRDRFLMRRRFGRIFVKLYYATSPFIANILKNINWLNKLVKFVIIESIIKLIKKM